MLNLLTNAGFLSLMSVIVSYIVAPIVIEQVKKVGEKQRKQSEEVAVEQARKLDEITKKIDLQNTKLDEIEGKRLVQDESIAGIMRYELIQGMSTAVKRGYTTTKEIEDIQNLIDPYHKMGGNGTVDIMYNKFKKLKIDDYKGEIL